MSLTPPEMSAYVSRAMVAGLTPRELEHKLRNHAGVDQIAEAFQCDRLTVELLMNRWGFSHLAGRQKSRVRLVLEAG